MMYYMTCTCVYQRIPTLVRWYFYYVAVDPEGSQALFDRASSSDKTLRWCGPGQDIDADVR